MSRGVAERCAALVDAASAALVVGTGAEVRATLAALERRGVAATPAAALSVDAKRDAAPFPAGDATFDVVVLPGTLEQADHPVALLHEARRVARRDVVVAGALRGGPLARAGSVAVALGAARVPWTRATWRAAFERVGLRESEWCPAPGGGFTARLAKVDGHAGDPWRQVAWELAYEAFETPEQEIAKFVARLADAGAAAWPRDARIADLFCGRGNGLVALERLGFRELVGVDLSPKLLARYHGVARCYTADCRALPLSDASQDVVTVNGGLHHLPDAHDDLLQVLAEVRRVLVPGGRFAIVEPWDTPYLRFAHWCSDRAPLRLAYPKLDDLRTMTRYEADTYFPWLAAGADIERAIQTHFVPERSVKAWGKWAFVGTRR